MASRIDRFPVRRRELERLRKRSGLTEQEFCERCRRHRSWPKNTLSRRTLGNWKAHRSHPSLAQIQVIADVLNVTPDQIADLDANVLEEFQEAQTGQYFRRILGKPAIFRSLVGAAERLYPLYTRHLSLNMHVASMVNRDFRNPGRRQPGYATIRIRSRAREATWIFAFQFFGVRVDYGRIMRTNESLTLEEFFTSNRKTVRISGPEFCVATWFDREPCRFVVRSSEEFEVEVLPQSARADLEFVRAPHHRGSNCDEPAGR